MAGGAKTTVIGSSCKKGCKNLHRNHSYQNQKKEVAKDAALQETLLLVSCIAE